MFLCMLFDVFVVYLRELYVMYVYYIIMYVKCVNIWLYSVDMMLYMYRCLYIVLMMKERCIYNNLCRNGIFMYM